MDGLARRVVFGVDGRPSRGDRGGPPDDVAGGAENWIRDACNALGVPTDLAGALMIAAHGRVGGGSVQALRGAPDRFSGVRNFTSCDPEV